MKVLAILSFIILCLGITFYISSPYIHSTFFQGPIEYQKDNSEKQQSPQISHQNTKGSPMINQTSQRRIKANEPIRRSSRPSTPPSQTSSLLFEKLKGYNNDSYRVDVIEEFVSQLDQNLSGNDLLPILNLFDSDSYRVDAIKELVSRLDQNLSGNDLFGILNLFNSDSYRVDAIKELVSRLDQNLSGNDLFGILNLFNSDSYRVDAIRAFQSRLKPSYSNSDFGRISQLFSSDSYRTEAFTLLR